MFPVNINEIKKLMIAFWEEVIRKEMTINNCFLLSYTIILNWDWIKNKKMAISMND